MIDAAKGALDSHGFGLSSVRFICGTQDIHKQLETSISKFHKKEDSILYSSCFDANAGIFEALLTEEDAVISDSLNHASIIDGIRLCKAQKSRYIHMNMEDLETHLKATMDKRTRMIVTDGIFSMDGDIAPLDRIVELARKYNAVIFVDECHATGFIGATGRGTPELFGVEDEIDIVNSTLGKALGGASGGYTTSKKEVVEVLRQKSRPYLFSNSLCPAIVGASIEVYDMLSTSSERVEKLQENTRQFREGMKKAGFNVLGHQNSPIAPILLGDARLATYPFIYLSYLIQRVQHLERDREIADEMMKEGIYVIGFSYPVVPKGQARIRVQLSAAHSSQDIDQAIKSFTLVAQKKGAL